MINKTLVRWVEGWINELDVREARKKLSKAGWEIIGGNAEANVYAKRGSSVVIKIIHTCCSLAQFHVPLHPWFAETEIIFGDTYRVHIQEKVDRIATCSESCRYSQVLEKIELETNTHDFSWREDNFGFVKSKSHPVIFDWCCGEV